MKSGSRKFYTGPELTDSKHDKNIMSFSEICETIKTDVYDNCSFYSPYFDNDERLKSIYCDYTASSQALKSIEKYIEKEVLPKYANTHTTVSDRAKQTTYFRHEARFVVRNSLRCSEHQSVIFTSNGVTGAINQLAYAVAQMKNEKSDEDEKPWAIFISSMEHHSNILPWSILQFTELVRIPEGTDGRLDLEYLENAVKFYSTVRSKVSFTSCASRHIFFGQIFEKMDTRK